MGYIYLLVDTRNGKKYVGKHNGKKDNYWSSGIVPNRIAKLHGRDVFERFILEDGVEEVKLNEREKFFIELHDSLKNGYNGTIGGDGGGHWIYNKTDEEKKAIKDKRSKSLKGRIFSEETKKKMSDSGKLKVITEEHKKNIGLGVKKRGGIPHTEETKKKLSLIMTGRKNTGHSNFMKENNPSAIKVSIEGVIYMSLVEAGNALNIHPKSVAYRIKSEKYINWFKI